MVCSIFRVEDSGSHELATLRQIRVVSIRSWAVIVVGVVSHGSGAHQLRVSGLIKVSKGLKRLGGCRRPGA